MHKALSKSFSIVLLISFVWISTLSASMRPTHAQKTMVVSIHELASNAGVEMLKAGGNAIDAAVDTGFALAVVHPQASNNGGGVILLLVMAEGAVHFLAYLEMA